MCSEGEQVPANQLRLLCPVRAELGRGQTDFPNLVSLFLGCLCCWEQDQPAPSSLCCLEKKGERIYPNKTSGFTATCLLPGYYKDTGPSKAAQETLTHQYEITSDGQMWPLFC